MRGAMLIGF